MTYAYDMNYRRVTSMTDGIGTTFYSYIPITSSPALGAGQLAAISGPLPGETIEFSYDELGRRISTSINGVVSRAVLDALGRTTSRTNALGAFTYTYDGTSRRPALVNYPNGQTMAFAYFDNLGDRRLRRITHARGATAISEFLQAYDVAASRTTNWSKQTATQAPVIESLGYDSASQLLSANDVQSAIPVKSFGYAYDPAENRLTELLDATTNSGNYNVLNELTSSSGSPASAATYEWDVAQRLTAINRGNLRTEFTYDGAGRRIGVRELSNGIEVINRKFVWDHSKIVEERTAAGQVVKRFFPQGVKIEAGPSAGTYFYTKDHLGSIRELVDAFGNIRARYTYEPYGARTQTAGDLDADFGFTGDFYHAASGLYLTRFRAYDPRLGRWLSRDPVPSSEHRQSPNLFAYVRNNPVNRVDPLGDTVLVVWLDSTVLLDWWGRHKWSRQLLWLSLSPIQLGPPSSPPYPPPTVVRIGGVGAVGGRGGGGGGGGDGGDGCWNGNYTPFDGYWGGYVGADWAPAGP